MLFIQINGTSDGFDLQCLYNVVMQLDRLGYLYVQIRQISHSETFLA